MMYRGIDYGDSLTSSEVWNILNNPPKEVYFIRCEQYVKIGSSKWPPDRLKNIRWNIGSLAPQFSNPKSADLIATESGGFEREKELHARFAHLRHTGEWFTEAPELTDYINALTERTAA